MNLKELLQKYAAEGDQEGQVPIKHKSESKETSFSPAEEGAIDIPGLGPTPIDTPEKAALEEAQLLFKSEKYRTMALKRKLDIYRTKAKDLMIKTFSITAK